MGNPALLATSCGCSVRVLRVFQSLQRTVEELRGDDHCTSTSTSTEYFDWLALGAVENCVLV